MSPWCIPSSFGSTWLIVWEEMWFKEFQDGGHLRHWNRTILAILNFHNTPMPPIMFRLNKTYSSVADVIWRFSRWLPWWQSGISERNLLATLNFHAVQMPSTKFPLHPTYCSGAVNNWRLSRWPPWWPSWLWFWWRCRKYEKLLTDIRLREGPWSTDHGIRWLGTKLQVS